MTSPRMRRVWFPWSTGSAQVALAATSTLRVLLPSILEAEMGREYESYTVTRSIFRLNISADSGAAVVTFGMIIQPEPLLLASSNPADDPERDWFYHEEFLVEVAAESLDPANAIVRDIASQRKSKGMNTEMFLYVRNRGALGIQFHGSGRSLILMR